MTDQIAPTASPASTGFNDAYKTLQANAEILRAQGDLDIDRLVPIVQQSAQAYQVCKDRIAAVREALQEHLKESDAK